MTKLCPRQQSALTPCVVVDGPICYTFGPYRRPVCVGCDAGPTTTKVGVDVVKLLQEFERYAATGQGRQFPIPTQEQIAKAQKGRMG